MGLPPSSIQVRLTIESGLPDVAARLQFHNASRERRWLYRVNACVDGLIVNDIFVIATAAGSRVPYIGRFYRRRAPKMPNDFIALEPGASYRVSVKLAAAYEFSGKAGRYVAHYEALDPSPAGEELLEMKSNPVEFRL